MPLDVDAVLFDLDDTLCVYERTVEELLALGFERADVEPYFTADDYRALFDEYLEDFDDVDRLRAHCFATIAERQGRDPDVGRAVADEYAAERQSDRVQPRPGAPAAVRSLAGDYAVGLITNGGSELQGTKLERIGLADAFDVQVFAGEDTAPKPEPEPFDRALAALDVAPERAVHVGNSLRSDVAGAHAADLHAVWTPTDPDLPEDVDDPEAVADGGALHHAAIDPTPDRVLDGVDELPGVLGASR